MWGLKKPSKSVPDRHLQTNDRLIYAIGDIHGRLDLLQPLMRAIEEDICKVASNRVPLIIFLGDYIDRGPDSRGVVDLILQIKASSRVEFRCLKGNHEQALLNFLEDSSVGPGWIKHGGGATLLSYGVNLRRAGAEAEDWPAIQSEFRGLISDEHLAFYRALELSIEVGDYVFVHAGVRPGIALDRQSEQDLLWIRDAFLKVQTPFERLVVHGHSPSEQPFADSRRIGVDTGAYATGVLSAVCLADSEHRFIQVKSR